MAAPATKDELIVRQSQMERAIEIYQLLEIKPSVREICRLSQILTEFIFDGNEKSQSIKDFEKAMGIKHHSALVGKDLVEALKKKEELKVDLVQELSK
jgi:hypothetical protein